MFARKVSSPSLESIERAQALSRACHYTAQFWADRLRLTQWESTIRSFAQELAAQTNPLGRSLIDQFQSTLSDYLFDELTVLEETEREGSEPDFNRWVGCYEYGPSTHLAEVAESFSISPLHFPPKTGFYVYPGRIITLDGEVCVIQ